MQKPENLEFNELKRKLAQKEEENEAMRSRLSNYEVSIKEFEEFVNKLWSGASILGDTDFSVQSMKNLTMQAEEILNEIT